MAAARITIGQCTLRAVNLAVVLLLPAAVAMAATNAPAGLPDELAVLRGIAGTQNLWGADAGNTLEDQLNCAEYLLRNERCREALPILLSLYDNVSSGELARLMVAGCSGAFLVHAGLCRVAEAESYHGMKEANVTARAEARVAGGYPWANARRMGLLLATLSFLPPVTPDEFDQTRVTALELYPATVWQMDHVTRRLAWRLDDMGRTRAALAE